MWHARYLTAVFLLLVPSSGAFSQAPIPEPRCYDLHFSVWTHDDGSQYDSLWVQPPPRIMLDTTQAPRPSGTIDFVAGPAPGSIPSPHRYAYWRPYSSGDSLRVGWSTGFYGVVLYLPFGDGRLVGRGDTFADVIPSPQIHASVEATPISCAAPPEFTVEDQPPSLSVIHLATGDSIYLGQALAEVHDLSEMDDKIRVNTALAPPFNGALEVQLKAEEGVIRGIVLFLPPDFDFQDTLAWIESEYGAIERGQEKLEKSEWQGATWGNRTTYGYLHRTRAQGEPWYVQLGIKDPRY